MKDFTDNLKAFAMFVLALFKSDDENKITAGDFARAHAKKFFAAAAVFVMLLAVSCGTNKLEGITPEEFARRYNENLASLYAADYDALKITSIRNRNNVRGFYNDNSNLFVIAAEQVNGSKKLNKWTITAFRGTKDLPVLTTLLLDSLESEKVLSEETMRNNAFLAYDVIMYPNSRREGNDIIYEKTTEVNGKVINFSLLIEHDNFGAVKNITAFLTIEIK